MRMRHVKISDSAEQSFQLTREVVPHFYNPLHFHNKIELTYIVQSRGSAFIGDYIGQFLEDDMFFLGSKLPHDFKNSPDFFKNNEKLKAEAIVLHFKEDFLGQNFFLLPEMKTINNFLESTRKGIKVKGKTKSKIKEILFEIQNQSQVKQITQIIEILEILATSNEIEHLSTTLPSKKFNYSDAEKLDKVLTYAIGHFKEKISLEAIANVASMNPSSFCRYFKLRTNRSFSEFILELRLENACNLLINSNFTIEQIALECGFESSSYFYRSFKKLKKETPSSFQKRIIGGRK
ncbi:MAG: helix-turn-helix domain-containing protein [Labilibaculum sp.]|nr:AraC family transcriptional regulator [Labilibaculum sp.]MBI9057566.1 helix-turn-helix domain-containing protein [Labilibaculum sp.]